MSRSNKVYNDVEFTKENSVQHFHYGEPYKGKGRSGNPNEYWHLLEKSNLLDESRDNYNGYYHEGYALEYFTVAPIFDKEGGKICWGMYYPDNSCAKFKTKKEAMKMMREINPKRRYDDDDEFNEYGLLSDCGCPDPVGFR